MGASLNLFPTLVTSEMLPKNIGLEKLKQNSPLITFEIVYREPVDNQKKCSACEASKKESHKLDFFEKPILHWGV
jgi:hypothetical protein